MATCEWPTIPSSSQLLSNEQSVTFDHSLPPFARGTAGDSSTPSKFVVFSDEVSWDFTFLDLHRHSARNADHYGVLKMIYHAVEHHGSNENKAMLFNARYLLKYLPDHGQSVRRAKANKLSEMIQ